MLSINKTVENGNLVYALEGRLDTVSSPELENELKDELADANSLTLDLAGLDYISSLKCSSFLTVRLSNPIFYNKMKRCVMFENK